MGCSWITSRSVSCCSSRGLKYRPSSYGWVLVSAAVEAAANEPFFAFMRTHVFEPLGMRDTTMDVATEAIPARAAFYWPMFGLAGIPDMGRRMRARETIPAMRAPPRSCPRRLTWCGSGWASGGKLLKSGTSQLLQTPQRLASGEETGYGLGWELETLPLAGHPTRGWPGPWQQRGVHRRHDVPHDVSRTRPRRRRDGQHFIRGHEIDCAEHRAGFAEQGEVRRASNWTFKTRYEQEAKPAKRQDVGRSPRRSAGRSRPSSQPVLSPPRHIRQGNHGEHEEIQQNRCNAKIWFIRKLSFATASAMAG